MVVKIDPLVFRLNSLYMWPTGVVVPSASVVYLPTQLHLIFLYRWLDGFFNVQKILFNDIVITQNRKRRWQVQIIYCHASQLQRRQARFRRFYSPFLRSVNYYAWLRLTRFMRRLRKAGGSPSFFFPASYRLTFARFRRLPTTSISWWLRRLPLSYAQRPVMHYQHFRALWARRLGRRRLLFRRLWRRSWRFAPMRTFFFFSAAQKYGIWLALQRLRFTAFLERLLEYFLNYKHGVDILTTNIADLFGRSHWLKSLTPRFLRIKGKMVGKAADAKGRNKNIITQYSRFSYLLVKWWGRVTILTSLAHQFFMQLVFTSTLFRYTSFLARWLQWQLEKISKHSLRGHRALISYFVRALVAVINVFGWLQGCRLEIRGKINGATRSLNYMFAAGRAYARSSLAFPLNYHFLEARTFTGLLSLRFWFF
jgi:hypothetical protein